MNNTCSYNEIRDVATTPKKLEQTSASPTIRFLPWKISISSILKKTRTPGIRIQRRLRYQLAKLEEVLSKVH